MTVVKTGGFFHETDGMLINLEEMSSFFQLKVTYTSEMEVTIMPFWLALLIAFGFGTIFGAVVTFVLIEERK